jgi:hypothetical protein
MKMTSPFVCNPAPLRARAACTMFVTDAELSKMPGA